MSEVSKDFVYETVQASERRSEIRIQELGNNVMTVWDKMEKRLVSMENKLNSMDSQMKSEYVRQDEKDKMLKRYISEHNNIHRGVMENQAKMQAEINDIRKQSSPFTRDLGQDIIKWSLRILLVVITWLILTKAGEIKELL